MANIEGRFKDDDQKRRVTAASAHLPPDSLVQLLWDGTSTAIPLTLIVDIPGELRVEQKFTEPNTDLIVRVLEGIRPAK